jgi:putative tricarboxylic transport membrane protein
MCFFGVIGYAMVKGGFPPAPLVLGFILGPMLENHLRQALVMSGGSFVIFVSRPISLFFVALTAISVGLIIYGKTKKES